MKVKEIDEILVTGYDGFVEREACIQLKNKGYNIGFKPRDIEDSIRYL